MGARALLLKPYLVMPFRFRSKWHVVAKVLLLICDPVAAGSCIDGKACADSPNDDMASLLTVRAVARRSAHLDETLATSCLDQTCLSESCDFWDSSFGLIPGSCDISGNLLEDAPYSCDCS